MPLGVQFGTSNTGLNTCVIRDIDVMTPRPRLPPRALPDDVRQKLGFSRSSSSSTSTTDNTTTQEEDRPLPLAARQSMGGSTKQTLGINKAGSNEALPPRHSLGGTMNGSLSSSSNKASNNMFGPIPTIPSSSRLSLGGDNKPKLLAALNNTGGPSMKEKPRRLRM